MAYLHTKFEYSSFGCSIDAEESATRKTRNWGGGWVIGASGNANVQ